MSLGKLRELSLLQIELVAGLSRAASLRDLAREFRLDPATVSRSLRDVETAIGAQLFERSRRGIQLNARGAEVSKLCEALIKSVSQIEEMPKNNSEISQQQAISIGSRGFLNVALASVLMDQESGPQNWRWRFVDGSPVDVLRGCMSNTIDVSLHLEDWNWPAGWTSEADSTMTWGLVARTSHPLTKKATLENVKRFPFAVAAYLNQDRIERASDIFPLKWSERILGHEAQTAATMKEIVLRTDHLAYLPLITIETEILNGKLQVFPLKEVDPVVMPLHLSIHQDRVSQKAFKTLKRAMADIGKKDQRLSRDAGLVLKNREDRNGSRVSL